MAKVVSGRPLTAPSAEQVHQGEENVVEAHEQGKGKAGGIAHIIRAKHGRGVPKQLG